jgi:mono/diheme cytochrome c family protein
MVTTKRIGVAFGMALAVLVGLGTVTPAAAQAEQATHEGDVTFTKDIAPILQRSCQQCHQPDSVAPMSLITYEDVRPWARAIKTRTGMGPVAGVMPPWYVEKNIGIQAYQMDPSLSDEEIAKVAMWADNGAPRGNPADMPPPKELNSLVWTAGDPDLVTVTEPIVMRGEDPDWWGEISSVPVGIDEARYVKSVEIREINDVLDTEDSRETVGGRFVWHHMIWSTRVATDTNEAGEPTFENAEISTGWPVHEVGRNADVFDPQGARQLPANSWVVSNSVHLHSNGKDTKAHLEIGWRFHPEDYKPKYTRASRGLGNGIDIDIRPNQKDQQLHAYNVLAQNTKVTTFEPHLHAPGARMCLEAIWGHNVETLTCAGYDHNWVRGYEYSHGYEPLLPKGTILHIVGYMDNTPGNRNIPDSRNWQGSGNRSVSNMFLDLGHGVSLTDEQFEEEMALRREQHALDKNDHFIGCPLCMALPLTKEELATQAVEEAEQALARAERALSAVNDEDGEDGEDNEETTDGQASDGTR